MSKREIINNLTFGERVAEDELSELSSYFVETDQWNRIFSGKVDVVYGPKGSGKSAIYSLLLNRKSELLDRRILIIPAENPRGTTAFSELVSDPPTTELEFSGLWKLYFLSLIAQQLKDVKDNKPLDKLRKILEKSGVLTNESENRRWALRNVFDYVRALTRPESFEGGLQLDPSTGMPSGFTGKITLREPTKSLRDKGFISVDSLFDQVNDILIGQSLHIWLVIDRLDVAFVESQTLEKNAIRALFKVYLDLLSHLNISIKIFIRNDIWNRVSETGFREASHITRSVTLTWDDQSLMNLLIRRVLKNPQLVTYYKVQPEEILRNNNEQQNLFYKIFPDQVESGEKKPKTFDWMLSRTYDGHKQSAPRELIHLLSSAREVQLRYLENGNKEPIGDALFERSAIKEALPEVSRVRLKQTFYAEYPKYQPYLEKLSGEKTEQTQKNLSYIWGIDEQDALTIAQELVEIGFFEFRGTKQYPTFWVPFLYRDSLSLVQGSADL
ncbi:hypothetical protein [Paenibacillus sp. SI8]|uniref:P-loop ATPase, Sll1717 family n=1 Tax=unclassified Paenibacillus TaxID=185978 RepID=UPI003467542E